MRAMMADTREAGQISYGSAPAAGGICDLIRLARASR